MKGQTSIVLVETQFTSPKPSNEESPIQVVLDDSPNQPKFPNIPQNLDDKCKAKMNEGQNLFPCKPTGYPML